MNKIPVFVTGNQNKADYLAKLLGVELHHQKVDMDELQSLDLHEIVEHKVRQAYDIIQAPVLVEDVSLEFCALGQLPGPFIKFFLESAGEDACCKMLDAFNDRSAIIKCTFGYFDGSEVTFFDSTLPGKISEVPRGDNGYGFDRIFMNEGYDITRAEMSPEENERTYHEQMKPIGKIHDFLTAPPDML